VHADPFPFVSFVPLCSPPAGLSPRRLLPGDTLGAAEEAEEADEQRQVHQEYVRSNRNRFSPGTGD
jgi:hypothetical protein